MSRTAFPATPADVAALSAAEFTCDLTSDAAPSLDDVCRRFRDDPNRAIVWLIRCRALQTWCAREGIAQWAQAGARTPRDICEAAAGSVLNDHWEFDAEGFCRTVDIIVSRRSRLERW